MRSCVIFFASLALLMTFTISQPAYSSPTQITIATFEGPDQATPVLKKWAQELEKVSDGAIQTKINVGATMAKPPEHYDLVVNGIADVTYSGLLFVPGRFPMAEVFEYPVNALTLTDQDMSAGMVHLYKKGYFDQDFKDVKVLLFHNTGPFQLQTTRSPLRAFSDFPGKKIRAAGRTHTQIISAMGLVPTSASGGELTIALEKGIMDGSFMPYSAMYDWKCENLIKHVTETGICTTGFVLAMNKNTYSKLPDKVKSWIDEALPRYTREVGLEAEKRDEKAKEMLLKAGGQTYRLSEADVSALEKKLSPIWAGWIAEGEKKGMQRQNMLKDLAAYLGGLGVKAPFFGYVP
jgi:TRAP-type transport system periplasmic protein